MTATPRSAIVARRLARIIPAIPATMAGARASCPIATPRWSGTADAANALLHAPAVIAESPLKSPARVPRRLVCALFSVLLLADAGRGARAADPSQGDENPRTGAGPLTGSYQGAVLNGNDFDPVLTAFYWNSARRWSGTYAIGEDDGIQVGVLDECEWEAAYLLRCNWGDAHGSGVVRWLFSSDYRAFRGYWGENADSTNVPWDGLKQ